MHVLTKGILLFAVVTVGLAVAGAADVTAAEDDLTIEVTETDAEPLVTVTSNDTAVGNASVNVTTADGQNVTYVGEGDYETDANGTVQLPAAEEDVTIDVTATDGNVSAATTVDLEAPASLAVDVSDTNAEPVVTVTSNATAVENASVNVTTAEGQNVTYVGEGDYETDANGTVTLPAAEENVTVDVTATVGNETATATADLVATEDEAATDEPANFGQLIREFIKGIGDRSGGIGDAVSDFATSNNPGNAPEHAGGPGNASDAPGNASANASDDRQGPPDHAGGNGADDRPGNGADGDGADGDDANDDAETESSSSDDNGDTPGNSGNAAGNGGNGGGGSGNDGGGPGNGNGPGN